jgi:protein-disulfide isomerase
MALLKELTKSMAKNHNSGKSDLEVRAQMNEEGRSMIKPLSVLAALVIVALSTAFLLTHRGEQAASAQGNPPATLNSKPVVTSEGWFRGDPGAKTILVEFGDFQCPSCALARLKVAEVLKKHDKGLKVVFKQYPMKNVHRNAMLAAEAAEAAGRQAKFWEMSELLFSRQAEWTNVPDAMTFFTKYAAELQLNLDKFRSDVTDNETRNKIYRDMLEGQLASVHSVPTFFLNGSMLENIKSEAEFQGLVDKAVQSAQ